MSSGTETHSLCLSAFMHAYVCVCVFSLPVCYLVYPVMQQLPFPVTITLQVTCDWNADRNIHKVVFQVKGLVIIINIGGKTWKYFWM